MKPLCNQSKLLAAIGLTVTGFALGINELWAENLSVAGDISASGSISSGIGLDIGTAASNALLPGIQVDYIDYNDDQDPLTACFDITDGWSTFLWRDNAGINKKMKLDGDNILTLFYAGTSTPSITLNGATGEISTLGTMNAGSLVSSSVSTGSMNVWGNLSTAGNLTANSLTLENILGFKNSLLLGTAFNDSSTAMSDGLAWGEFSTAMSSGNAKGMACTAMSYGYVDGYASTAMSYGHALGDSSTAMSCGSSYSDNSTAMTGGVASSYYATAMSGGWAARDYATAMSGGYAPSYSSTAMSGGSAYGDYSMAAGMYTNAPSYSCTALGSFNTIWGSASTNSWVELDPLLLVGNGTDSGLSNAITTLKNGQTTLTNKAWSGNHNVGLTGDNSYGEALVVEGHTRLTGNTVMKGNTVIEGKVTISVPQGDISMGIYGQ